MDCSPVAEPVVATAFTLTPPAGFPLVVIRPLICTEPLAAKFKLEILALRVSVELAGEKVKPSSIFVKVVLPAGRFAKLKAPFASVVVLELVPAFTSTLDTPTRFPCTFSVILPATRYEVKALKFTAVKSVVALMNGCVVGVKVRSARDGVTVMSPANALAIEYLPSAAVVVV